MATFLELRERVQRRVIDLPQAVQDEVPTLVNQALRTLQRKHNYYVMQALGEFTTTALTRSIGAKPSDWKEARDRPYYLEDLGSIRRIRWGSSRVAALARWENDEDGEPRWLLEGEEDAAGVGTLEVWPLPDAASDWANGEYRIKVPYWKYLPALSADADTNWFTVNAEEYIVNRATAEGFALDWDEAHYTLWDGKAQEKYNEVIVEDKYRWLVSGDLVLVPRTDAEEVEY